MIFVLAERDYATY